MKLGLITGIAGFLLLLLSIGSFIFELTHFTYTIPPLVLWSTVLLFIISLVLLTISSRLINSSFKLKDTSKPISNPTTNAVLEKNNKLVQQWGKTTEQRDRLKLIEVSENAKK